MKQFFNPTSYSTVRILVLLLCLQAFVGCEYRNLEERPQQQGNVEIVLDWQGNTLPSKVCYLFYDQSGALFKEVTGSAEGIKEQLPAGEYHFVAYSCDAQQVGYRGLEHHNTAEVFALEAAVAKATGTSSEILQPQAVYAASSCQGIGELVVELGKTAHLTAAPKPLTKQLKLHFTVKNVTRIESLSGVLNGIAPSMSLTTGKANLSSVSSTSFTGVASEQDTYVVDIQVFDLLASNQDTPESNTMDITLEADGEKYEFTTDLTKTITDIADKNEGIIPIEVPIEMEIIIKEIGGISVSVKPWYSSGTGAGTIQ